MNALRLTVFNILLLALPILIQPATSFASRHGGGHGRGHRQNAASHGLHRSRGAHGQHHSQNPSPLVLVSNINTEFSGGSGQTRVSAELRRHTKVKNGSLSKDSFGAEIEFFVAGAAPSIQTLAAADAAKIQVVLSRNSQQYAICTLSLGEVEEENEDINGEDQDESDDDFDHHSPGQTGQTLKKVKYEVSLRLNTQLGGSAVRVKSGSCDTNLNVPGVENTIPDVQAGDTATFIANDTDQLVTGLATAATCDSHHD